MRILLTAICLESGTDIQLALYYLKSCLLKGLSFAHPCLDVEIRVFNENQNLFGIAKNILRLKPHLIGFSCYLWNIEKTLSICRRIKKINPAITIVLGGPEASPRAVEILTAHEAIDAVIRGEGEVTFSELVQNLISNKSSMFGLKGITFRHGKNIIHNPDRPQMDNLSSIPSPYLNGLINLKDKNIVDVPLETMRGCFSRCDYCYYHKNFPLVRYFPLERIEKELKLILFHRPHEVYLMDATFNSSARRAKSILRLFIRYNRGSNLHVELKAEFLDAEMAKLLYQANAYNIEIGIQSIKRKTLHAVHRGFNRQNFKRGVRLLNKYGIYYEIQLIDALPFQSYSDIKMSLDWLYGLHPARLIILRHSMLAGTTLRDRAADYGIVYSHKAPYYVSETNAITSRDLSRVEALRLAMERLYDSQVFLKTLYLLKRRAGIKISDIMEDWTIWQAHQKRGGPLAYPEFMNRKLPEFLKYICRKRANRLLYKALLPDLILCSQANADAMPGQKGRTLPSS